MSSRRQWAALSRAPLLFRSLLVVKVLPVATMETRASIYSNVGVRIMATRGGDHTGNIAVELFRIALECLRSNEGTASGADNRDESMQDQSEVG
jgi:hypothetical protein